MSMDIETQQVVVMSTLPAGNVQGIIETSGRKAVLQGFGSGKGLRKNTLNYVKIELLVSCSWDQVLLAK